MKNYILILIAFIFSTSCGDKSKIGKYTKEELPSEFSYVIVRDESDKALEKNELYVELSDKISEGQIATIANELYNSRDKERRFYIFYTLKEGGRSNSVWAVSHFDPNLEILINGLTATEELSLKKKADNIDGEILGEFFEGEYTLGRYIVFKKIDRLFVKTIFKDGSSMVEEMRESQSQAGIILNPREESNGEYYILTGNTLELYNSDNKRFTVAKKY